MLEAQIAAVAQQFAREVVKLENLKAGSSAAIELSVTMPFSSYTDNKPPKIEISCRFWSGNEGCTVTAGSLSALMDEVHRRCDFADKQSLIMNRNNAALMALEAPKGWDSVET
jgi:hypothetical protein